MLFFDYLKNLDAHILFLQKKIKDKHTLFLVGWCIRDILLGIEKKPTDIDFTMTGDPKTLDAAIDKKGMSYFMTEKFGTITLINKAKGKRDEEQGTASISQVPSPWVIKYELTPLRTESGYEDFRHPGEIIRSNDILLDSNRRDFTINAMYYTNIPYKTEYTSLIDKKNIQKYTDDEKFLKDLDAHECIYIANSHLLIIQEHKHIAKLFADGKLQTNYLVKLLSIATIFSLGKKSETSKQLRILVDPHKGIHDSINRRLRTVGDPDVRFTEDALRIIRAIRFVNVINEKLKNEKGTSKKGKISLFDFIKDTRNSLKKNHALVENVAKERIKEEIMKAFTVGNPFGFIGLLDEAQLLQHLFPALYTTKYIEQPIRYHPFDIYTHTLLTLFELQKISSDPLVRLSMLYHDVGKVDQFGAYGENLTKEEIRAIIAGPLNHRRSSPEYAKKDFKALGFSSKEITTITRYIANHHKPEEMLSTKEENIEKKVRTFLSEAWYEAANNVLDITIADRLWQYNPLQNSSDISDVYMLKTILKKLHKQEWQFTMKDLAINGSDIMTHFTLPASAVVWVLLKKTLARVINDIKVRNTKKEIFGFLGIQMKHMKQ